MTTQELARYERIFWILTAAWVILHVALLIIFSDQQVLKNIETVLSLIEGVFIGSAGAYRVMRKRSIKNQGN